VRRHRIRGKEKERERRREKKEKGKRKVPADSHLKVDSDPEWWDRQEGVFLRELSEVEGNRGEEEKEGEKEKKERGPIRA